MLDVRRNGDSLRLGALGHQHTNVAMDYDVILGIPLGASVFDRVHIAPQLIIIDAIPHPREHFVRDRISETFPSRN